MNSQIWLLISRFDTMLRIKIRNRVMRWAMIKFRLYSWHLMSIARSRSRDSSRWLTAKLLNNQNTTLLSSKDGKKITRKWYGWVHQLTVGRYLTMMKWVGSKLSKVYRWASCCQTQHPLHLLANSLSMLHLLLRCQLNQKKQLSRKRFNTSTLLKRTQTFRS